MDKEQWTKPELIVLLRNHPEETLSQDKCKHPGTVGSDNTTTPACAENNVQCFNSSDPS